MSVSRPPIERRYACGLGMWGLAAAVFVGGLLTAASIGLDLGIAGPGVDGLEGMLEQLMAGVVMVGSVSLSLLMSCAGAWFIARGGVA